MKKNKQRINHDKVCERMIIDMFLKYKDIPGLPDYPADNPDCVVGDTCIEETSVRSHEKKL